MRCSTVTGSRRSDHQTSLAMVPRPLLLASLARPDGLETAFDLAAAVIDEAIGSKLTTATVFDRPAGRLRRVYTQNASAYAVGGFKPIPDNRWTVTLLDRHEVYTALSIGNIAEDFSDWKLIQSLGCESIANLPVVIDGETIGAFNLLNVGGYYTSDRLAQVGEVMPYATLAITAALLRSRPHSLGEAAPQRP